MKIKLLGIGCDKESNLRQNLEAAMLDLNLTCPIEEVHQVNHILEYRVARVPALFINNRLVSEGNILEVEALKTHLMTHH